MLKKSLRKDFISQRQKMLSSDLHSASMDIALNILLLIKQKSPKCLLLYSAFGQEISLSPLLSSISEKKEMTLGLPRIGEDRVMHFHYWTPSSDNLIKNRLGILEPDPKSPIIADEVLNQNKTWSITPALAVDKKGVRLGYGGGYYDTFFAKYPQIKKIAVAHHSFAVESLPCEKHDVLMDMLVTEKEIMIF